MLRPKLSLPPLKPQTGASPNRLDLERDKRGDGPIAPPQPLAHCLSKFLRPLPSQFPLHLHSAPPHPLESQPPEIILAGTIFISHTTT